MPLFRCAIIVFFAFFTNIKAVVACFSIVAGKEATATLTPLISRTSDSKDARRAKHLKIYRTMSGEKLYLGLPYWDLAIDPSYDMAQLSVNRYGVALSATQTIQSNRMALLLDPPSQTGQGVSEPNIPAIVMPMATSAREGIEILGKAIESRGVNDGWGFGVQLADENEVWYLETLSGHQWVAIRIPDDQYFVAANGPGQIQEYLPDTYDYLMSHYRNRTPIEFAEVYGFAEHEHHIFNFRKSYGDLLHSNNRNNNFIRIAYAQHKLSPSTQPFDRAHIEQGVFPMFLRPDHLIEISDIQNIQSSHYEEFPNFDPYSWSYEETQTTSFYYPIANPRTSNAHVTIVKPHLYNNDVNISQIEYVALGMPGLSVYLPIYYGLTKVPTRLSGSTSKADDHSLFWQFRKIQSLVFLSDYAHNIPYDFFNRKKYVQMHYEGLNRTIQTLQKSLEENYQLTQDTRLINEFTQTIVDLVSQKNEQIIAHFIQELHFDDVYQLHNDLDRNLWFAQLLRHQDCFYRRYRCDMMTPVQPTTFLSRETRYSDGEA